MISRLWRPRFRQGEWEQWDGVWVGPDQRRLGRRFASDFEVGGLKSVVGAYEGFLEDFVDVGEEIPLLDEIYLCLVAKGQMYAHGPALFDMSMDGFGQDPMRTRGNFRSSGPWDVDLDFVWAHCL